jgi:hypothetical protein
LDSRNVWISEDRYSARFSHMLDFLDLQIGIELNRCRGR